MSGPFAEGGPLPPVDRELLAEHERQLADWRREIEEQRGGRGAAADPGRDREL